MRTRARATIAAGGLALAACRHPTGDVLATPSFDDPPTTDGLAPWAAATTGTTLVDGLLPVRRRSDGAVLIELAPDRLDRDLGLGLAISEGIGALGLLDGENLGQTRLVRLHRVGHQVYLLERSPRMIATEPGLALAVERDDAETVLASLPVVSEDGGRVLIDASALFTADLGHLATRLAPTYGNPPGSTVTADLDRSFVTDLRDFPQNLEVDARLTFAAAEAPAEPPPGLPDPHTVTLGVRWSLFALPAVPMTPRLADDRAGYFVEVHHDLDRATITGRDLDLDHLRRWRLERADPTAAHGPPVEPLRFYLDRSIPAAYRPYVRDGILAWNRAFAAAGFDDAIVVEDEVPDGFDYRDLRYATVHWTAANELPYYGYGRSYVDPRTGEILDADVMVIADFLGHNGLGLRSGAGGCQAAAAAGDALALGQLAAAAGVPGVDPEALVGDAVRALVVHEVGHTLGLRHDFHGSADVPYARLADAAWTTEHGISSSVMDYLPLNLSLDPAGRGRPFQTAVGAYDIAQIRFGYSPLPVGVAPARAVAALAAELTAAGLVAGDDEDTWAGPWALDPASTAYDLGDDPVAWARDRLALLDAALAHVGDTLAGPADDYAVLRDRVPWLLAWRTRVLAPSLRSIGGLTVRRVHRGDPGVPLVPLPAAVQRRALAALVAGAFAPGAYAVPAEVQALLGPAHAHRSWSDLDRGKQVPLDVPVLAVALDEQRHVLRELLSPVRLARILDNQRRLPAVAGKPDPFTLGELFTTLSTALFVELDRPRPAVDVQRRALQASYVEELIRLWTAPPGSAMAAGILDWNDEGVAEPEPPHDARAQARHQLVALAARLARVTATAGDDDTRAHLEALAARIEAGLRVGVGSLPPVP